VVLYNGHAKKLVNIFSTKFYMAVHLVFLSRSDSVYLFLYCFLISALSSRIQLSRGVGIPLTGLTPPHVCTCP
jgi:hypothetical protein